MTPTPRLRFVERTVNVPAVTSWGGPVLIGGGTVKSQIRVLQQWWHENDEPPPSSRGEWRDVPLEAE